MKTLVFYIDAFKEKLNLTSDYECAKLLGINRQQIHKIRNGDIAIGREKCARIATALKINPMEIIASIEANKEKNPEVRAIWVKTWKEAENQRLAKEKEGNDSWRELDEKNNIKVRHGT